MIENLNEICQLWMHRMTEMDAIGIEAVSVITDILLNNCHYIVLVYANTVLTKLSSYLLFLDRNIFIPVDTGL